MNLNLKFLWDVPLYVSFQTTLVSLNLELCRVSYTLLNPYCSDKVSDFQVKLQKFITNSILIQWPYNLYVWKALNVQFHIKIEPYRFDGCISVRTQRTYGRLEGFHPTALDSMYLLSFLLNLSSIYHIHVKSTIIPHLHST